MVSKLKEIEEAEVDNRCGDCTNHSVSVLDEPCNSCQITFKYTHFQPKASKES
jgi:bacterioferritin-associated ferredoxin